MEHRFELENLLLNGLPETERRYVAKMMLRVDAESLRRRRSETIRSDHPIKLDELEDDEMRQF